MGKVVHTVKRAGTYVAKVPPQELHKIAVHVRAVRCPIVSTVGRGHPSVVSLFVTQCVDPYSEQGGEGTKPWGGGGGGEGAWGEANSS